MKIVESKNVGFQDASSRHAACFAGCREWWLRNAAPEDLRNPTLFPPWRRIGAEVLKSPHNIREWRSSIRDRAADISPMLMSDEPANQLPTYGSRSRQSTVQIIDHERRRLLDFGSRRFETGQTLLVYGDNTNLKVSVPANYVEDF